MLADRDGCIRTSKSKIDLFPSIPLYIVPDICSHQGTTLQTSLVSREDMEFVNVEMLLLLKNEEEIHSMLPSIREKSVH